MQKGHHEPIIKEDLLQDIENGNFIVCLVPKIDTLTGEVGGAEAVVRYHHKDLGIVDPGRYLNMLEENKNFSPLPLIFMCLRKCAKTLHKMGSKRYSDDPGFGEFCRGNSSAGRTCG